ncbi:AlkA N-terminal domain-containing protein [Pseudonocardia sp. KRD291]|uniref:DNA-3-methyladenine glycosylase 2 family protein n=1 Tax=Pseudonocardia sp. KRD291 TaxID=2792007 RepID=UPI001C4A0678|nr:AlkA N-terminal domain-containing protein [Pseudonocardia sp. KRD291]MBW0101591.1 DNA-3-methyladenine glycosylase 2 family protein [Pseudonocardia sp. KRD291]
MLLDHERCYRAVTSRDARFDGQFVTAVRTTRIYCRPSCPVPPPRAHNVEFLRTPAAAQAGGYRACRRCLPDAVPGSPEWNVRADLAARAMRLIGDGTVERDGITGLAARLGYSPRHLNRVLGEELGAGPLALARAHRAHTARLLVETTALGMADVAFAAGFHSVRQFNDTVREVYGVPPGTLRAEAARRGGHVAGAATGPLTLRLPYREPFDPYGLLGFFDARAVDGVESVRDGTYRRTLRLPHGPATVSLDLVTVAGAVPATLRLSDPRDLGPAVARLRRMLDLDADPEAVDAVLGADPALAPSVAQVPGIRLAGSVDGAETAVRTVLGQQVSVAAARTAAARMTTVLGDPLPADLATPAAEGDEPWLLFPAAATIAERGHEVLTGPARRISTVLGVCAAIASGDLALDPGRDPDELRAELVALPGVGPWSAGYLAMRVLGDPDELLASDLAVRRGAEALALPGDATGLRARSARWAPWRSYAATHLWRAAAARSAPAPTTTRRRTA